MKVGDKVRTLHGNEEGTIVRFLDKNLIEIEIEDGFGIPVLKNELVVVASEEEDYFDRPERPSKPRSMADESTAKPTQQGIYLAYVSINDQQLSLHLVNATDFELPYSAGEDSKGNYQGISAGVLAPQTTAKLKDVRVAEFDQWSTLVIQLLFHRTGYFTLREPLQRRMNFKANAFFKSKGTAPVLQKPAFVFRLDEQMGKPLDPDKLKEGMYAKQNTGPETSTLRLERPPREVDLHIEKLTQQYDTMSNPEMLELQLRTFEDKLDQAIATGMDEITFIHGVGSGVLRAAIHKKLSKIKNIQYFKDTMRDTFGYGATLVRIK